MIICEYDFDPEDPDNPGYSMAEVEYYAWIPYQKQSKFMPNHRLSLRKNLVTQEYEVYRRYQERRVLVTPGLLIDTGKEIGEEDVAFKSKGLSEAIKFACEEWDRFHSESAGLKHGLDQVCQHKYPVIATFCKGPQESGGVGCISGMA